MANGTGGIRRRRGKQKAIVATARAILEAARSRRPALPSLPGPVRSAPPQLSALAEHRYLYIYLYIEELPEHAGHGAHTVFVDDLDERVESIGARGIEPPSQETYGTVCAR